MKRTIILIIAIFAAISGTAQPRGAHSGHTYYGGGQNRTTRMPSSVPLKQKEQKGTVYGTVVLTPDTPGQPEVPGAGVAVQVISSLKDQKYAVTNEKGQFSIRNVEPGSAVIVFTLLGYETIRQTLTVSPGMNKVLANLKPDIEALNAATVTATVSPVTVDEDTVIFNAAAVKTLKGEMAIDILEQMPGVEITDSGVKVLNEDVSVVYVDGALLFGNAPMKALENLAAEDVVSIKSYQEYANKDPYHRIRKTEEKRRVLDVATKSKPKMVKTADFISGGGFDTDSTYHKFRYTLGATGNIFSESFSAGASVNANNINDGSNRKRGNSFRVASGGGSVDLSNLKLSANVTKKKMSPNVRNFVLGSVHANYSYNDGRDINESRTQRIYFPSKQFDSRETNSTSYSNATSRGHNVGVSATKALRDGSLNGEISYSRSLSTTERHRTSYNVQDGGDPVGTASVTNSNSQSNSYSASLAARKGFDNKYYFGVDLSGNFSDSGSGSAKVDTTTSTINATVLDIDGSGQSWNWSISPRFRYEISDYTSLSLTYSWSDSYRQTDRVAYDVTDPALPVLDTVNTQHYTNSGQTHRVSLGFSNHFENIGANLRASINYSSHTLDFRETFPEDYPYSHPFNSLTGSINIGTESMINRWSASWSTSCNNPSLEQVRPKLDNSNLYSVSIGNPEILQSRQHNFRASYSTVFASQEELDRAKRRSRSRSRKGGSNAPEDKFTTFSISADYSTTFNPIVSRQTYFTDETYLPEYDYTMPAQSNLRTYENADMRWSAGVSARLGLPLKAIKCILNTSVGFDCDNAPSYVNEDLVYTTNMRPSVRVGLRSNFSRIVRLNLSTSASYIYTENDSGYKNSYYTEPVNFGWEINNIFKHMYIGGNYYKVFTQQLEYGKLNDNILDANIGIKWGPRNNFNFDITAHDIFNNTTGFSTSMSSNYVTNTWNHRFGRYVMAHFSYSFYQGRGRGNGRR